MIILNFKKMLATQLLPRNLRISAILVAIYQVLIAHVLLFVILLGLIHAEEMTQILSADIADQKEREDYIFVPTLASGESLNTVRFRTASHLAFVTLVILYIGTAISAIYLLSCLALLVGTLRNRSELMLPWLILDSIGAILVFAVMIAAANSESNNVLYYSGGEIQYWIFCFVMTVFNVTIWSIVFIFYQSIRSISKMRHMASVAIPMPAGPTTTITAPSTPDEEGAHGGGGGIRYQFKKEKNMYLGNGHSNSVKHYISNEQSHLM